MLLDLRLEDLFKGLEPTGGERQGHKYVSREWKGTRYEYKYADEPAAAHGPGQVPEIEQDQSYKIAEEDEKTGDIKETEAFKNVPKHAHTLVLNAQSGDPEKDYKAGVQAALAQPGVIAKVKHNHMEADIEVSADGDGKVTVKRTDEAPSHLFTQKGELAKSRTFSTMASYELWFLQTSNTVAKKGPDGKNWLDVRPTVGTVNKETGEIDWSKDPLRVWRIQYSPGYTGERLKGSDGKDLFKNAKSFRNAEKQIDNMFGVKQVGSGQTATRGKHAKRDLRLSKEDQAVLNNVAAETVKDSKHGYTPPAAGSVADQMENGGLKRRPHPSKPQELELAMTPNQKHALVQKTAKEYWGSLVSTALALTNTQYFEADRQEWLSRFIGMRVPIDLNSKGEPKPPEKVELEFGSPGYKAMEAALDGYNPDVTNSLGERVGFTSWVAGGKGKVYDYMKRAMPSFVKEVAQTGLGDVTDSDGKKIDQFERMTASEEEVATREHYQNPEEHITRQEDREDTAGELDPETAVPQIQQMLAKWSSSQQKKNKLSPSVLSAAVREVNELLDNVKETKGRSQKRALMELSEALLEHGIIKSIDAAEMFPGSPFTIWLAQRELFKKAMEFLTKDKDVDPTHEYDHMEGDEDNPKFFFKDPATGNLVRYTNAPSGHDDYADFYGDAKLHASEPLPDKNPEYFTPDGRKMTRVPETEIPQQIEWNQRYNRFDPKNLWVGRWRDPNTGEYRFTYVQADIRQIPKLATNYQNVLTDARMGTMRAYVSKLFNTSDKLKDQMTAVAMALLDQGKFRAIEIAALTPDVVIIEGSLVTLGNRKIYCDPKTLAAFEMMKRSTPAGLPLFSVPEQNKDGKVNIVIRRMMGPHYLARVMDMQGISLMGLQTYHATLTFSREVERLLTQYRASWDQAVQHALLVTALEWGHDFTVEPDPLRVIQLVQEILVDPVALKVLQQNAKGLGSQPAMELPDVSVPIPWVSIDLQDQTPQEKEFSGWLHSTAVHDFAEIPPDPVAMGFAKSDHEGLVAVQEQVNRKGKSFEETFWENPNGDQPAQGGAGAKPEDPKGDSGKAAEQQPEEALPLDDEGFKQLMLSNGFVESLPNLPADTKAAHTDPATGQYTPERQALHQQIIKTMMGDAKPVPDTHEPTALMLMGGPGSGKSSTTDKLHLDNFVHVDPDKIKEMLPEYAEATKGKAMNAAVMAHEESSDIAKKLRQTAISQRTNVLLDGVGSDLGKMHQRLSELRAQGYHVALRAVHLPIEQAMQRARKRGLKSGRIVPMEMFQAAQAIPQNFEALVPHVDDANAFDNNVRMGEEPLKVYSSRGKVSSRSYKSLFKRRVVTPVKREQLHYA